MRPAGIDIVGVIVRLDTLAGLRVGRANGRDSILHWNSVRSGIGAEVFVKCPVFLAYYYKNEEEQDKTVSIPAMLKMFDELGTPAALKQKMAFPQAGNHVIASYIRSNDWQGVERETDKFLAEQLTKMTARLEAEIRLEIYQQICAVDFLRDKKAIVKSGIENVALQVQDICAQIALGGKIND